MNRRQADRLSYLHYLHKKKNMLNRQTNRQTYTKKIKTHFEACFLFVLSDHLNCVELRNELKFYWNMHGYLKSVRRSFSYYCCCKEKAHIFFGNEWKKPPPPPSWQPDEILLWSFNLKFGFVWRENKCANICSTDSLQLCRRFRKMMMMMQRHILTILFIFLQHYIC